MRNTQNRCLWHFGLMLSAALSSAPCRAAAGAMPADALPPLPKAKCQDPATLRINEGRRITFANPLPRMTCGGVRCGTYNNMELSLPGLLTTSDYRLGMFLQKLRETIMANRRLVFVDGVADFEVLY